MHQETWAALIMHKELTTNLENNEHEVLLLIMLSDCHCCKANMVIHCHDGLNLPSLKGLQPAELICA